MTATLGCMRFYISKRWLIAFVVLITVIGMQIPVFADEVFQPIKEKYFENQPGADDPRAKIAFEVYLRREFQEAYEMWLPLAKEGNAEAQYRIGRLFSSGEGQDKDGDRAIHWYQLAYNQGHDGATNALGFIYRRGEIVQQDLEKARMFYLEAATRNHPPAQNNLGIFYAILAKPHKDYAEAYKWLFLSVQNGRAKSNDTISKLDNFASPSERAEGERRMREWLKSHPR